MNPLSTPRYSNAVALVMAIGAFAAAFATLDDYGLTIDEPINLSHGRNFAIAVFDEKIDAESIAHIWSRGPEHPPLSRFLIGVGQRLVVGSNRDGVNLRGGRTASAAAYAGIVFLVAKHAATLGGLTAGVAGGLAVASLPRLFAHGHLASPEVISAFFLLWAWIAAGKALLVSNGATSYRIASVVGAGVVLGFALLTKLTAALVPFTVLIAVLTIRGRSGLAPLVLWGVIGLGVFFAGWPWMWPVDLPGMPAGFAGSLKRYGDYLATAVRRADLYVWYFGRQYRGNLVPWHFAPLFFVITTPIPALIVGGMGLAASLRTRIEAPKRFLIAVAFLGSLAIFCLPIQRYDGERLFLFIFPLWCILAGIGATWLVERCAAGWRRLVLLVVLLCLAAPVIEIRRTHPFELSYYNVLVGGAPGAERLGLEPTYWGDSLTRRLLDNLAAKAEPNDIAVLAPTLYAGHAGFLTSRGMAAKNLRVVPGDSVLPPGEIPPDDAELGDEVRWGVLFHRTGYLIDPLPSRLLEQGVVMAEEALDGVWLARVVRLPPGWRILRAVR